MKDQDAGHDAYFAHLQSITWLGRLYKRRVSAPYLYNQARNFGGRILEVGCGIGAGVLGAYPKAVSGIDVNPAAIEHCRSLGLDARLIRTDTPWDIEDGAFDACILDNVLEHVRDPSLLLHECARVTGPRAGLVVAVPGSKGFASDADHKIHYDESSLRDLNHGWTCVRLTGIPLWIGHRFLSKRMRQFCVVAVYRKRVN